MGKWIVASDRLAKAPGQIVNESDLSGCDIAALLEAGHLVPVPEPAAPADADKE